MSFRLDGLRLQLLGIILVPFSVILMALAVISVRIHQEAMRQLVAERDQRATRAAAAAIEEQLHHRQSAIRGLAFRLADNVPPERIIEEAAFLDVDFDLGLAVIEQGGHVLSSSLPDQDWSAYPIKDLTTGFSTVIAQEEDTIVLVISLAGQRAAVGAFSVASLMRSAIQSPGMDSGEYSAFLTDDSGQLLQYIGKKPSEVDLINHPGVQAGLRGEMGASFIPSSDGEHVVAFSPIQATGWTLIFEEPWKEVASPLLDLSLTAPLALAPALLLTLVALWFVARQVIEPLREVQNQAEQLASGDFEALKEPPGGIAEIQNLHATLESMSQRLQSFQKALQGYIGSITQAQEDERRRLARELHDDTIQDLIAIDQRVQLAAMKPTSQNEALNESLGEIHDRINKTILDVRRLTRGLRPIYLEDLGLVPALEMLAHDAQQELGITVSFELHGEVRRVDTQLELVVYRIVQEAISNVSRHAKAKRVWIDLAFDAQSLSASIRDDGVGFSPPDYPGDLASQGHFGLMGMHERAGIVGAKLDIRSSPGDGSQILISVSLPDQA